MEKNTDQFAAAIASILGEQNDTDNCNISFEFSPSDPHSCLPKEDFLKYLSKEDILEYVHYWMIPSEEYERLPLATPSKKFFDLTALYAIDIGDTEPEMYAISDALKDEFGITEAELDEAAQQNNSDIFYRVLKLKPKFIHNDPLLANVHLISCEKYGNAILLFSQAFQNLANHFQDDLYVLQISSYDVWFVPASAFQTCHVDAIAPAFQSALQKLAPNKAILGTSIYRFDQADGTFSVVDNIVKE